VAAAVEAAVGAAVANKPSIGLAVGELVDRSSGSSAVGAAVDAKSPGVAEGACNVYVAYGQHACMHRVCMSSGSVRAHSTYCGATQERQ
jgi:hypothetical protein